MLCPSFCESEQDIRSAMRVMATYQYNAKRDCNMPCNFLIIDVANRHVEEHNNQTNSFLKLYFMPRLDKSSYQDYLVKNAFPGF